MKRIIILTLLLFSVFGIILADNSQEAVVNVSISAFAEARKTDSQVSQDVNSSTFTEKGHNVPGAPVKVESFSTTYVNPNNKFQGQDWYEQNMYAFGHYKDPVSQEWDYNDLNPEDISNGLYDAGGDKYTILDSDQYEGYLFLGNHTRLWIGTNYNPEVLITVPTYMSNGTSQIEIKRVQIEWDGTPLAIVEAGAENKKIGQCSKGNYEDNGFGIFVLIKVQKAWWEISSGEYTAELEFTIAPPSGG
jgi:hypothetical protein